MQDYKKLKVWHKAHQFTMEVYNASKQFPREEIYGLTSQLRRCASSIPSNIVEGCGRFGPNELPHFLNISLGSANESEYFLLLARDQKMLQQDTYTQLYKLINEIKAMLIMLIKKLRGLD
jgi:four helix bundle protein